MTLMIRTQSFKIFCNCFFVAAALLLCSFTAESQSSQSSYPPATNRQSTISVTTELVVLPVSVTDGNGNFVSGLSAEDFRVYEDGRLQKVMSFQQEDTPVTVGLIVDHSRSMSPNLKGVAAAVSTFAQSSNPQDEMFVVDFNDTVSVEPLDGNAFTNDAKVLERAVSVVRARGTTALYDAVAEGIEHLQLSHLNKHALIIVSDGGDNASTQKLSQILDLARRYQVMIYAIGLMDPLEADEDASVLRRLCKDTGGISYFPSSAESVGDVSKEIARDLREQYTLGFQPEKTNAAHSFRKIGVKVTNSGHGRVHVRTRRGYSGTEQGPPVTPYDRNGS